MSICTKGGSVVKKVKNFEWAEHLLIAFYIGLFAIPAITHNGYNLEYTIPLLFKTFPTNYLLYFVPVAFYVFFKKNDISKQEKTVSSLFLNFFSLLFIYTGFTASSANYFYTTIAILALSVIFININDITASLTLLPGLFITKLGLAYIFTAYIPVLFLMMIKTGEFQTETNEKTERNLSHVLLFAYLYTSVLTAILLYKKKIPLNITAINPHLALADDYINMIAGIILILTACVLFIIRAFPVIRKGNITETISIILAAIYPLFFAVISSFYSLISYNFKTGFAITLLMYVLYNIQLSITYKNTVGGIMPEKLNNSAVVITAAVLLCSFCFNRA